MVALQANKTLLEMSLMFIRMVHLVAFRISEASCCNARCHTTALHVLTQWRYVTRSVLYVTLCARNAKLCKETDTNVTKQFM